MAPAPSLHVSIGIAALVGWRIYSRVRRTISRQKLTKIRPWLTAGSFPVLIVLLLGSLDHPVNLLCLRFATFYLAEGSQRFSAAEFGRSPLTLLIFGTLAGYCVAYAIGLLRWRRRVARASTKKPTGE